MLYTIVEGMPQLMSQISDYYIVSGVPEDLIMEVRVLDPIHVRFAAVGYDRDGQHVFLAIEDRV